MPTIFLRGLIVAALLLVVSTVFGQQPGLNDTSSESGIPKDRIASLLESSRDVHRELRTRQADDIGDWVRHELLALLDDLSVPPETFDRKMPQRKRTNPNFRSELGESVRIFGMIYGGMELSEAKAALEREEAEEFYAKLQQWEAERAAFEANQGAQSDRRTRHLQLLETAKAISSRMAFADADTATLVLMVVGIMKSMQGTVDERQRRMEVAERLLRREAQARPENAQLRESLGATLVSLGELENALRQYELARQLGIDSAEVDTILGLLYMQSGNLAYGAEAFLRATEASPEDSRLREHLGAALVALGEIEGALRQYELARRLGGASAELHTILGMLYMQSGNRSQGLEALLNAAEADPRSPEPQLNLARYRLETGQIRQARKRIQRAKRLAPEDLQASLLDVEALIVLGREDAARRAAENVVRQHPESIEGRRLLDKLKSGGT